MTRKIDKVSQDEQRKEMTAQKHGFDKRSANTTNDEKKSKQMNDSKLPKKP